MLDGVFGRVVGVHIKDEFITEDGLVDTLKMQVIARLGYKDYTTVETKFSMDKRMVEDKYIPQPSQAAE